MAIVHRSVRGISRYSRLGYVLAGWAQRHYAGVWAKDGPHEVVAEHADRGLRMRVDPRHHIGGAIYWKGFHSGPILRCLDRLLHPQMTLIDVGANQGEITLFAAKRLSQGKVVAFEPVDALYRRLLDNVRLNDFTNVEAYNYCLADWCGEAQLFGADEQSRHHAGGWNEGLASMTAADVRSVSVGRTEVHRLDEVFPTFSIDRLDVLKIDVEGAELPVLRGARETLSRYRPSIVVELNRETFESAGYTVSEVCEFLRALDYEGFPISRTGGCIKVGSARFPDFCDTLWIPRDHRAATRPQARAREVLA